MRLFNIQRKKVLLVGSLIHLSIYLTFGLFPHHFAGPTKLIPYSAQEINVQEADQAPAWQLEHHFLGTDHLGRDILAQIIFGAQTSLWVSVPAMLLTTFIGLLLGLASGYFGNDGKRITLRSFISYLVALVLGSFYGFYLRQFIIEAAFSISFFKGIQALFLALGILAAFLFAAHWLQKITKKKGHSHAVALPLDEGVLKLTELFSAIPRLILILALATFLRPSFGALVMIIGFTSWTGMARLVRGEILKVKSLQFVEAGKALGLKDKAIIFQHILPNALPSIIVAFTFGLASLLALESTLSFLGIGLPPQYVSWGKIMVGMRYNLTAWWLVVFPGAYLALTILALHYCSNFLLDKVNKQAKHI